MRLLVKGIKVSFDHGLQTESHLFKFIFFKSPVSMPQILLHVVLFILKNNNCVFSSTHCK